MIRLKEIDMEHYDNMKGQLEKLMEEKAKLEAKINEKKDRIEKERYRLTQEYYGNNSDFPQSEYCKTHKLDEMTEDGFKITSETSMRHTITIRKLLDDGTMIAGVGEYMQDEEGLIEIDVIARDKNGMLIDEKNISYISMNEKKKQDIIKAKERIMEIYKERVVAHPFVAENNYWWKN